MPLTTERVDLQAESDALTDRMVELSEAHAEHEAGSDAAQEYAQRGQRFERFREGVEWARNEWGDIELEFGALSHGERLLFSNVADDIPVSGAETNAYIAVATLDAPYLEHDPDDVPSNEEAIKQTAAGLSRANISPKFVDWVEWKITEISRMGIDEGKSYSDLVLEKRASQTSESED